MHHVYHPPLPRVGLSSRIVVWRRNDRTSTDRDVGRSVTGPRLQIRLPQHALSAACACVAARLRHGWPLRDERTCGSLRT